MGFKHFIFGLNRPLVLLFSFTLFAGCGLRQLPPIKYVPKLGQERSVSTVDVLAQALDDKDVLVRAQAVQLLNSIYRNSPKKEKKHISKILGKASRDSDPGIRLQSIEILGTIETEYSNPYLQEALKDTNPIIRERVMQVLKNRHNKED
jgi:HEAT repeat protein